MRNSIEFRFDFSITRRESAVKFFFYVCKGYRISATCYANLAQTAHILFLFANLAFVFISEYKFFMSSFAMFLFFSEQRFRKHHLLMDTVTFKSAGEEWACASMVECLEEDPAEAAPPPHAPGVGELNIRELESFS